MSDPDLQKQVRDFIIQKSGAKLTTPDQDCVILGAGLMDSFGLVTLLAEVEGKFGVFPDLMIHDPSEYSTLHGLTRIILHSLGVTPTATVPDCSDQPADTSSTAARIERLHPAHPLWSCLPDLFKDMFSDFADTGVQLPLVTGGENLWLRSIESLPDKAFFIAGAIQGHELQGFISGQIKILPSYLGGGWVGEVTYLFVRPSTRRLGLASSLVLSAMKWFQERGASSVELQVLSQNSGAQAFWQRQSFQTELIQFRRHLGVDS